MRNQDSGNRRIESAGTNGGWRTSLATVLARHNAAKVDGSVASSATRDKRQDVLFSGFKTLRTLGYRLDNVDSLRGKHIEALVHEWHSRGLSASTLQNGLSIFRVFANWIGKSGMVRGIEHYLGPGGATRSSIATHDKSWTAKGVDAATKISEVRSADARVALQLELAAAFGLRAREAMQLRPHIADRGSYLLVTHGTKGGRDRVVPIDTREQRALIDRARALCALPSSSTIPQEYSLAQWKNHFYQVVRSCGISRRDGFTAHGLRHQYACDRYKALTGHDAPVRGGAAIEAQADHAARLIVAEDLGHGRASITTHYLGR